jgi:translation initiation factor IF-2
MSTIRISKVLSELNIGLDTAVDFLATKAQEVDRNRNAKIDQAQYDLLTQQFATDKSSKDKAETLIQKKREEKEAIQAEREQKKPEVIRATATLTGPVVSGKIDLAPRKPSALSGQTMPPKPVEVQVPKVVVPPKEVEPKVEVTPQPAPAVKVDQEPKAEEPKAKPSVSPDEIAQDISEPKEAAATQPKPTPDQDVASGDSLHHETQYQKLDGPKMTGQVID